MPSRAFELEFETPTAGAAGCNTLKSDAINGDKAICFRMLPKQRFDAA